MVLRGRLVLRVDFDGRGLKGALGVAKGWVLVLFVDTGDGLRFGSRRVEFRARNFFVVIDDDLIRCFGRGFEGLGDDNRDNLPVVPNLR